MKPNRSSYLRLLAGVFAVSLVACGGSEPTELDELNALRDSLRTSINAMSVELREIEAQINALSIEEDLIQVSAFEVRPRSFNHYFTVQGNIETDRNALIYPETQGLVKQIFVREGERVNKGDAIIALDTELMQRNIDEVQTQYELALDIFERQSRLWDQKIGSEVQFLEAKANKERLENTLATLNRQKSMGTVRAPFEGVVDQLNPKIGEMANPAMPVARVISLENMFVRAQISENYVGVVKEGMPVEVILPGNDTLVSAVRRVGKFINPENRTFEMTLDLDPSANVRPNMYCALRVNDLALDSVVVLRSSMIMQDIDDRDFVYVLEEDGDEYIVRKQNVTSGSSYGDFTWVSDGLTPGAMLVDKGARRVVENERVKLFSAQ